MSDFEKVLDEYKEQTKPMCEALGCIDLLDDFLVDIELSRAKYHHFYQAGQQSQQTKIDELQARIDATEAWIEANKKTIALSEWHGYTTEEYVDADDLLDTLKGNKDEN